VDDDNDFAFPRLAAFSPDHNIRRDIHSIRVVRLTVSSEIVYDILRFHSNLRELDLLDLNIDETHGQIATISGGGPRVILMDYVRTSIALSVIQLSRNLRSLAFGRVPQINAIELLRLHGCLKLPCLEELELFSIEDSPLYGVVVSSVTGKLRQLHVRWLHTSVLNALVNCGSQNVITDLNIDRNPIFGSEDNIVRQAIRAFVRACPRLRHLSILCPWMDFFTALDAVVSPLLSILVIFSGRYYNGFSSDLAAYLVGPRALSTLRRLRVLRLSDGEHKTPSLRKACNRRAICLASARVEQYFERRAKRR